MRDTRGRANKKIDWPLDSTKSPATVVVICVGKDSENREEKTLKSAQSPLGCYWQSREKLRLLQTRHVPSFETKQASLKRHLLRCVRVCGSKFFRIKNRNVRLSPFLSFVSLVHKIHAYDPYAMHLNIPAIRSPRHDRKWRSRSADLTPLSQAYLNHTFKFRGEFVPVHT